MPGAADPRAGDGLVLGATQWIGGNPLHPPAGALVLFCFAHAGGGAVFFHPWQAALAMTVDVRPIVLPGRESRVREPPYRRVEQILEPLCTALEPHVHRPYALFGHSMGAIIAFETARRLAGAGMRGPVCLVVSGRRGPRLPTARRRFSTLPDNSFLTELARLNGTPAEVLSQPELMRAMLPALRADFELNEMYEALPGPCLGCPIVAYAGSADPEVHPSELLGWQQESAEEFTLRVFPGDHFYLKGARPDVVSALRRDLERAVERA